MARPGVLNSLYEDLQHWRYNNPAKDAELMSLRFIKPINLNRQMVMRVGDRTTLVGCQGGVKSGYSCSWADYRWVKITDGDAIWYSTCDFITFTDGSLCVTIGYCYSLKTSKTSPELRYNTGDRYYKVIFPVREAKIRCPVLENPIAYLLEAIKKY